MGADIRMKTAKKELKVLDHAKNLTYHLKEASIKAKDTSAGVMNHEHENVNDYAASKVQNTVEAGMYGAVYRAGSAGRGVMQRNDKKVNQAGQQVNIKQVRERGIAQQLGTKQVKERILKENDSRLGSRLSKNAQDTRQKGIKMAEHTKNVMPIRGAVQKHAKKVHDAKAMEKSIQAVKKTLQISKVTAKSTVQGGKTVVKGTASAARIAAMALKSLISAMMGGGWITILLLIIVLLFGGMLAITGGSSGSAVSVSEEVEAYEPLLRQYATQYGIPDYVELLKAVMMQESGGRGNDPMQASESSYNTKYPRSPNGITDPEYSIACGVQAFASVLTAAKVESPVDIEHIKLALQAYNFGNGYLEWAVKKDGGYTAANAIEFSDMMAKRMGWSSYGDKQYVEHVLRYYSFGQVSMGTGSQAIVQVALAEGENAGGQKYWSWYGFNSRQEWCACFVSWCADQCGYIESGAVPKFAYCPTGADWFKARGQWKEKGSKPNAGDIIFFDWDSDGVSDHVGIVEKVVNGTVYTVEGNSRDIVKERSYTIESRFVYGYGIVYN